MPYQHHMRQRINNIAYVAAKASARSSMARHGVKRVAAKHEKNIEKRKKACKKSSKHGIESGIYGDGVWWPCSAATSAAESDGSIMYQQRGNAAAWQQHLGMAHRNKASA